MLLHSLISRAIFLPQYRVFRRWSLLILGHSRPLILLYVLSERSFFPQVVLHYHTRYYGLLDLATLCPLFEYLFIYLTLGILLNSELARMPDCLNGPRTCISRLGFPRLRRLILRKVRGGGPIAHKHRGPRLSAWFSDTWTVPKVRELIYKVCPLRIVTGITIAIVGDVRIGTPL